MKVVFVSGAYRAPTKAGIRANVRHARKAADRLWKLGYAVLCPHMNSAFMNGSDDIYLMGDLELLRRCDAIFMLEGWQQSRGAIGEYIQALMTNKEIMYENRSR